MVSDKYGILNLDALNEAKYVEELPEFNALVELAPKTIVIPLLYEPVVRRELAGFNSYLATQPYFFAEDDEINSRQYYIYESSVNKVDELVAKIKAHASYTAMLMEGE